MSLNNETQIRRTTMKTMDVQELANILDLHKRFLAGIAGGRLANLRGANLCMTYLCGADLREADLCMTDLCGADLSGADLREADLRGTRLREADLWEANLCGAILHEADLSGADLRGANLHGADLCSCIGFLLLPVQDMRGHSFPHAVWCDGQWRVRAGCRDFTIPEALEHWGPSYQGNREQGDLYLYAIEWLMKQPTPMDE